MLNQNVIDLKIKKTKIETKLSSVLEFQTREGRFYERAYEHHYFPLFFPSSSRKTITDILSNIKINQVFIQEKWRFLNVTRFLCRKSCFLVPLRVFYFKFSQLVNTTLSLRLHVWVMCSLNLGINRTQWSRNDFCLGHDSWPGSWGWVKTNLCHTLLKFKQILLPFRDVFRNFYRVSPSRLNADPPLERRFFNSDCYQCLWRMRKRELKQTSCLLP